MKAISILLLVLGCVFGLWADLSPHAKWRRQWSIFLYELTSAPGQEVKLIENSARRAFRGMVSNVPIATIGWVMGAVGGALLARERKGSKV